MNIKKYNEIFEHELTQYRIAFLASNETKCIHHLGRAHIIAQSSPLKHLYVHFIMLRYAIAKADFKEVSGQILRILVTLPGHLLGKVPAGNIGWSTVRLTEKMPVPEDLKEIQKGIF